MTKPVYRHISMTRFDTDFEHHRRANAALEIALHGDELDAWRTNGVRERILRLQADYDPPVCIHGPVFGYEPASMDRAVRDLAWKRTWLTLEAAELAEPETVVFHSSYIPCRNGFQKEVWTKRTVDFYTRMLAKLPDPPFNIVLENIFEDAPRPLATAIREIDHPRLGFCLDIGHFNMFNHGADLERWLAPLRERLFHLHLHDNHGREDLHLPPGRASIDYTPLLRVLSGLSHPFSLTVEGKSPEQNDEGVAWVRSHVPAFAE